MAIIALHYRLSISAAVVSAVGGAGSLAGVYIAWVTARRGSASRKLGTIADEMAGLLFNQWDSELAARQRHDRTHLAVSWDPSADLSAHWADVVAISEEPGWPAPPRDGWPTGPGHLHGDSTKLTTVYGQIPTGRMVVLGEAGSGKSMLLARLLIDLLNNRADGDPVPVLVTLGSWPLDRDRARSLPQFIEERLIRDHPSLGGQVRVGGRETSQIRALLEDRMIVPILDGLDEIPARYRQKAVDKINDLLVRPGPVVVSSRKDEYEQATDAGRELVLGSVALELRPLGADAIQSYLAGSGLSLSGAAQADQVRWAPVLSSLGESAALTEAFRTPLFVTLARAIYNPRRGERPDKLAEPAELCDLAHGDSAEPIKDHLFDAFIPAVYRPVTGDDDQDDPVEAARWLTYLAGFLERQKVARAQNDGSDGLRQAATEAGGELASRGPVTAEQPPDEPEPGLEQTQDLEWWALRDATPRALAPAIVGSACGIVSGVAAALGTHVGVGIGVGFGTGMVIALAIGRATIVAGAWWRRRAHRPDARSAERLRPGRGMCGALLGAAIGGVAAGAAHKIGFGHEASLFSGLPESLGIGLGGGASTRFPGGLAGGLVGGFVGGALEGLWLGVPAGIVNGFGVGLAVALAVYYVGRREPAHRKPTWIGSIGVSGGIVIGLAVGLITWRQEGVKDGIGLGLILGSLAAWPFGLRDTPQLLMEVSSPRIALTRDAHAFWITSLSAGLASAVAGFFGGGLASIFEMGQAATVSKVVADGLGIGISSGIIVGLTFGFYHAASPTYLISNWWLALRGKLPWDLMKFLEDAHRRSVLRQNGAVYQFRHEKLRLHLIKPKLAPGGSPEAGGGNEPADPGRAGWRWRDRQAPSALA